MVDARFAAYVALMGLLIVIPGPDMLMVTRTVLRSGRRAGLVVAWGVAAGIAAWACASLIGVAVLLERSVVAFTVLKIAGGPYLVYLGLRSLFGRREEEVGSTPTPALPGRGGGRDFADAPRGGGSRPVSLFGQGMLTNLLNPKAGAIFATVVPSSSAPATRRCAWP